MPRRQASREGIDPEDKLRYEVGGIFLLTAGAILLVTLASGPSGVVTRGLSRLFFAAFGMGAYVVPVVLVIFGISLMVRMRGVRVTQTSLGLALLFAAALGMAHLAVLPGKEFEPVQVRERGGLVGAVLVVSLRTCFGQVGSHIFLLGLGAVAIAIMSRRPLANMTAGAMGQAGRAVGRAATRLDRLRAGQRRMRIAHQHAVKSRSASSGQAPAPIRRRPQVQGQPAPPPSRVSPAEARRREMVLSAPDWEPPVKKASRRKPADQPTLDLESDVITPAPGPSRGYRPPGLDLLDPPPADPGQAAEKETAGTIRQLEETLASFNIPAKVVSIERGPTVTRYEVEPARGIRVSKIAGLADDLALALAAMDVRIEAPVPGKSVIGVEVPNKSVARVSLREILETGEFARLTSPLGFALGKDIAGNPVVADLARMPHILVAGATNSGKSMCLNAIILSILSRALPGQVRFMMIDPKRVELSLFDEIPHLISPVVQDAADAAGLLRQAIDEVETRYRRLAAAGVRNITEFNDRCGSLGEEPMPFIVIVIDELADLMMQAAAEFEHSICRIAQLARAVGIHLVVATQRPSVNVVTGTIKANIPSRIAFAVSSQMDSRVILDCIGAERLVGAGDMLYLPIDASKPRRVQGAYVSAKDINRVVEYLKTQGEPHFLMEPIPVEDLRRPEPEEEDVDDDLLAEIVRFVRRQNYISTSLLQRKFRIGYNRAARIVDLLEERGIVGPADGSRPRRVLPVGVGLDDE